MFEELREALLEYVDLPEEKITPDTRFMADMHMNSLDIMTLIGELEDRYDITIESEDLHDIFTIQELMDYIQQRL